MRGESGFFYADNNELSEILNALRPTVPDLIIAPLNLSYNKADYYWINQADKETMKERKQISEALSDIDAVEEQLQHHLGECDELELIVEGIALPVPDGVQTYHLSKDGRFFIQGYHHRNQPGLWARWESFKWNLWHEDGIYVAETNHWQQTVQYLAASYRMSLTADHTTLKRYTIEHIPQMDRNPHVDNLMRLKRLDIGPKRAQTLVDDHDTMYGVLTASYVDLVGEQGGPWVEKFFKGIGRRG